jgi:hypothetical protein
MIHARLFQLATAVFSTAVLSTAAADPCLQIAGKIVKGGPVEATSIDAESTYMAEAARKNMESRSTAYDAMLAAHPDDKSIRDFDSIVIGGGPNGTSYATNAKGRVLVINDSSNMGTFSRFGDMFYVNSGEFPDKVSPNAIPGLDGQAMTQVHDMAHETYVAGRVIGNATDTDMSLTKSDFHLGDHVVSTTYFKGPGGTDRIAIHTQNGETFTAPIVITASGMGGPKYPFKDQATLDLIAREHARGNPRIRFIEEALSDNQALASALENPLDRTGGKRIGILGGGNGGEITAEHFLCLGPRAGYAFQPCRPDQLPKQIHLIGLKDKEGKAITTGDQFKKAEAPRYKDLAPALDKKQVIGIAGHAQRIEEIKDGPDKGAFRVFYGNGPKDFVVDDEVVVGAGYDQSQPAKLAAGLTSTGTPDAVQTVMVKGKPTGMSDDVNIAKQVVVDGKQVDEYIIGPASSGLETIGESGGDKSPRIEVMSKRSAELAHKLNAKIAHPRECLTCGVHGSVDLELTSAPASNPVFAKASSSFHAASEPERDAHIKLNAMNVLNRINVPDGANVEIKLIPSGANGVRLESPGLAEKHLNALAKLVEGNPELISLLSDQPQDGAGRGLTLKISHERRTLEFFNLKEAK